MAINVNDICPGDVEIGRGITMILSIISRDTTFVDVILLTGKGNILYELWRKDGMYDRAMHGNNL